MKDGVLEFVIDALQNLHYDARDVTGETTLGPYGLDLDSLALAELLIRVHTRFGYKFPEDDNERISMLSLSELAEEVAANAPQTEVRR